MKIPKQIEKHQPNDFQTRKIRFYACVQHKSDIHMHIMHSRILDDGEHDIFSIFQFSDLKQF